MSKDPAFLFYVNDYIGGTVGFTNEMHGAYLMLLLCQFNSGHFSENFAVRIAGNIWSEIKHKFSTDKNGLFYQKRMEEVKEKRISYTKSRSNNRRHTKIISTTLVDDMGNGNGNGNRDRNGDENSEEISEEKIVKKTIPPEIEEVRKYCIERGNRVDVEQWFSHYESNGWMVGKNKMKDWRAAVRTWEKNSFDKKDEYKPDYSWMSPESRAKLKAEGKI